MSRRALSLAAYLAYARGGALPKPPDVQARPPGPVIWAFAEDHEQGRALASLCIRLLSQRPEISVFVSGQIPDRPDLTRVQLPADTASEAEPFAETLRPDVALWAGRDLRPALLDALDRFGAHLIALDAQDKLWRTPAPRWMPDPGPATLTLFNSFYAADLAAIRRLRRLGVDKSRLRNKGPLIDNDPPPPCDDATHEDLAQQLSGRPVWLAANVTAGEAGDVLRAHRMASRLAHRLLLIMVPATEADFTGMEAEAAALQMRVCNWDAGDNPEEHSQVLLTEGPEELGLWFRLAPLVFLGGSLTQGRGGQDPYLAAALGAAILYGPNVGQHVAAYSRLVDAGAARIVRDADSLAAAVSHLVAPDQAAVMAHAGWDLVSSGATLVDAVLSEICAVLDNTGEQ